MRSCDIHNLQFDSTDDGEIIPETLRLICPRCNCAHTEDKAETMVQTGGYIHRRPDLILTRPGFQWGALASLISPQLRWLNIAEAQLKAGKTGNLADQIYFDNSIRARPFKVRAAAGQADTALKRLAAEPPEPAETAADTADPMLDMWNKLLDAAASQSPELPLQNCLPVSLRNSVLTIAVPADAIPLMRGARLKLLTMLQSISGDWAILVDFVNSSPETLSVPETAAEETVIEESPAEEEVVFSNPETAAPVAVQTEEIPAATVDSIEVQNFTDAAFENENFNLLPPFLK